MARSSFRFLNRMENAIFKKYDLRAEPVSSAVATSALISAAICGIALVIMSLADAANKNIQILFATAFGLAYCYNVYKAYARTAELPTAGSRIGYCAYVLTLFLACFALFGIIAAAATMIIIIVLILWFGLTVFLGGGSSKGKKKLHITYADGTSETMEEKHSFLGQTTYGSSDGRTVKHSKGICGEDYFD